MLISVYVINTRQFTVSQGDNFNTKSIFELPYFNCVFHLHLPLSQLIFIFLLFHQNSFNERWVRSFAGTWSLDCTMKIHETFWT